MSGRRTRTETIDGVELQCTEMEFCDAVDLLADMTAVIAPAGGAYVGGVASRGLAIGEFAKEVAGGKLTKFLTRVLATTTIIVKADKLKVDLLDSRDKLNAAFSGRPKYVFPAVKLALEVSFKDFLDEEMLKLLGIAIPKKGSVSAGSSPSTDGTG